MGWEHSRRRLLIGCHGKAFDLAELYGEILADRKLAGLEMKQRFYEIGSPPVSKRRRASSRHREWLRHERETTFAEKFLAEAAEIVSRLDRASLEKAAKMIGELRATGGRLFILGVEEARRMLHTR